jgi:hypothetical protein
MAIRRIKRGEVHAVSRRVLSHRTQVAGVVKLSLKEKRGEFIKEVYDSVEGDDSRWLDESELYSFAKNHDYTNDEVYSLAMHFDRLGLMKAEPVFSHRIAHLKLTPIGTRYVEEGEGGLEHQYYERSEIIKAPPSGSTISDKDRPCVFLCYARPDGAAVRELYRFLHLQGFKPWMDTADIPPGLEWEPTINKAIKNSDFFILCLTRNSVDRRGVMQKEIRAAFDKKEEMLDDDIYLISVRLEDCDVRDEKLRKSQWVDLFRNDGHDRLLFGLNEGQKRRKKWGSRLAAILSDEEEVRQSFNRADIRCFRFFCRLARYLFDERSIELDPYAMAATWGFGDRDEVTNFFEQLRRRGYIDTDTGDVFETGGKADHQGFSVQLTALGVSVAEKVCP